MKFFKRNEFKGWFPYMDKLLLEEMDAFREAWGSPVLISPVTGAIGRRLGDSSTSGHNIDKWGVVKAIDLFPKGMDTPQDFKKAYEIVKLGRITGFGVYPDWKPSPGIHIDVKNRVGKGPGNPGTWSAFKINGKQTYFPLDKALLM